MKMLDGMVTFLGWQYGQDPIMGFSGARREYLSGFQKRKKERRKTVVDRKVREEREKKKEFQKQVRWFLKILLKVCIIVKP